MKNVRVFTTGLVVAVASLAQSQILPSCAISCQESVRSVSACSFGDFACLCSDIKYGEALACCIKGACSASDATESFAYMRSFCEGFGIAVPTGLSFSCGASGVVSTVTQAATAFVTTITPGATVVSLSGGGSSSGLSSGAKIGIGVGAGLGALILIVAIVIAVLLWKRRSSKNKNIPAMPEHKGGDSSYAVSPESQISSLQKGQAYTQVQQIPPETSGFMSHQSPALDSRNRGYELDSSLYRGQELDGRNPGGYGMPHNSRTYEMPE